MSRPGGHSDSSERMVNQWSILCDYNDERKSATTLNNVKNNNRKKKTSTPNNKSIQDNSLKLNILQELPQELIFQMFNCLSLRECCLKLKRVNRWFNSIVKFYLESGQVRELNICKEVYYSSYLKEKEGLLESNELFNFFFRSKEEIERMKYFRSVFVGNFVNGVQRLVFEKLKDFPIGLLVNCGDNLQSEKRKTKSKNKKVVKPKSNCLFSNFETFWKGLKYLEINSATFCNHALNGSDFDFMDDEKSGLELLTEIVSCNMDNLTILSFRNTKFTAEEAKDCKLYRTFLTNILEKCGKLESICIENSNGVLCGEIFQKEYPNILSLCVIDMGAGCINVKYFPKLTKLVLHHFEGSILDILATQPHLETLVLNHCLLSELEAESLKFPINLKHLDISYSKFFSLAPDSGRQYPTLGQISECYVLSSLSIIKVEYIDNYYDFRCSQNEFNNFIESLPINLRHLELDGLQKIQSLQSLKRFTIIETLHCYGSYCRGVDNIKMIQHFTNLRSVSFDCIQALGRDLSYSLEELSTYKCNTTLNSIHIERSSIYDLNLDFKMQYIQIEKLPSLPNLNSLHIIGYYFANEDTILKSKEFDLKTRVTHILPRLRHLVISSMLSSSSGLRYLRQTHEIENNAVATSCLLHFDFWKQLAISKKLKKKTK